MAERKAFLLRLDRELFDAVQRWADDDLRSVNGQVEFILRRALRDAGRHPAARALHPTVPVSPLPPPPPLDATEDATGIP